MEVFMIRGWYLILFGCGGTSTLARGATLAARWLYEPQPINNRRMGVWFPHRAGRYLLGRSLFSSSSCWRCIGINGFLVQGWVSSSGAADSRTTAHQRPADGVGVSTPCGAVSIREVAVFVTRWSKL